MVRRTLKAPRCQAEEPPKEQALVIQLPGSSDHLRVSRPFQDSVVTAQEGYPTGAMLSTSESRM